MYIQEILRAAMQRVPAHLLIRARDCSMHLVNLPESSSI